MELTKQDRQLLRVLDCEEDFHILLLQQYKQFAAEYKLPQSNEETGFYGGQTGYLESRLRSLLAMVRSYESS